MIRFERTVWWSIGLLLLASAPAVAQIPEDAAPADTIETRPGPATLLSGMPEMGFYAGPFSRFGYVENQLAVYPGMRLGVVLGRTLAIGLSGGLLANHIALDSIPGNDLSLEYGGLELEGIIGSDHLIHGSVRALIGPGLLSAGPAPVDAEAPAGGEAAAEPALAPSELILIFEPAAELTLNVSRMLRFSFGASHRIVRSVDSPHIANDDLSGWLGSFAIKIAAY
ncbi:MAG: hypothetical protein MJB57_10935 [Gemmatimonadetes bacterium]|nr:hypothetical protein [Gemmatimonadota bacterium]